MKIIFGWYRAGMTTKQWPPEGGVRHHVLMGLHNRSGICRMEWAKDFNVYEVSSRIAELRNLGWPISSRPCKRHDHRRPIIEYYLEAEEYQDTLF